MSKKEDSVKGKTLEDAMASESKGIYLPQKAKDSEFQQRRLDERLQKNIAASSNKEVSTPMKNTAFSERSVHKVAGGTDKIDTKGIQKLTEGFAEKQARLAAESDARRQAKRSALEAAGMLPPKRNPRASGGLGFAEDLPGGKKLASLGGGMLPIAMMSDDPSRLAESAIGTVAEKVAPMAMSKLGMAALAPHVGAAFALADEFKPEAAGQSAEEEAMMLAETQAKKNYLNSPAAAARRAALEKLGK